MKKLLGISLIAALAVSPMMANAAAGNVDKSPAEYSGTAGQEPGIALSPAFDLMASDASDSNLATGGYVKGAYNAAIKAVNAENHRAKTVEGSLETLEAFENGEATDLATAIQTTKVEADANKAHIGTVDSTNGFLIRGEGQNAEYESTVSEAITKLAEDIDAVNTSMTSTFATQEGVENTIKEVTVSGTVNTLAEWGSTTLTPFDISASVDAGSVDYATANAPAEPGQGE